MKIKNTTPYAVYVKSGRAAWDKIIKELTEAFPSRYEAEGYAATVEKFNPSYCCEIVYEG